MVAATHSTISVFFSLVVLSFWNISIGTWHIVAMITFPWLPDLDSPGSGVGRIFYFISRRLNFSFGHRGFIHSFPFLALLVAVTAPVFFLFNEPTYSLVIILWIAWSTHVLADCFTTTGVRLLYPSSTVYVFPKNELLRFNTGNVKVESIVCLVFVLLSCVYFYSVVKSDGLISFLRIKFAQPKMAGDQFTEFQGFKYIANATVFDKSARMEIALSNAEVLFADKENLIIREGSNVRAFHEGEYFELKRVSLRKSEQRFAALFLTNESIERVLSSQSYVAMVGSIQPAIPFQHEGASMNGGALRLFYFPFASVAALRLSAIEETERAKLEAERMIARTGQERARVMRAQIAALERERLSLVADLNRAGRISDQLKISGAIKRIEAKQESIHIEIVALDMSQDSQILAQAAEEKKKMVTNLTFTGVLIK